MSTRFAGEFGREWIDFSFGGHGASANCALDRRKFRLNRQIWADRSVVRLIFGKRARRILS
jgi:hypothetical protein